MSSPTGLQSEKTLPSPINITGSPPNLPESKTERPEGSQSNNRDGTPSHPDDVIPNTYASNKELREREVTKLCFKIFKDHDDLRYKANRDRIGSLLRKCAKEALPLFEDGGADYQLHFGRSGLKTIPAYAGRKEPEPDVADRADSRLPFAHTLKKAIHLMN